MKTLINFLFQQNLLQLCHFFRMSQNEFSKLYGSFWQTIDPFIFRGMELPLVGKQSFTHNPVGLPLVCWQ